MTLYQALVKAEEVRSASDTARLTPSAYYALLSLGVSKTEKFLSLDISVPESMKSFRITTVRPKRGLIAKCKKVGLSDSAERVLYRLARDSSTGSNSFFVCTRGLTHVFGKVPDFLFLSKKVEIAK